MSCIIFAYSYLISHVSKPKSEGELGNKDLRLVNLVLLGKWRWRLITRWEALWKDIIGARYAKRSMWDHRGGRVIGLRGVSNWWKKMSLLETSQPESTNWCSSFRSQV